MKNFVLVRISLLSLLVVSYASTLRAQKFTGFTHDNKLFITELTDFMKRNNEQEAKKLMKTFEDVWNSGTISDEQKERIYGVADALMYRKARAFPQIENYLLAVMAFAASGQTPDNYNAWENSLLYLMNVEKATMANVDKYNESIIKLVNSRTVWQSNKAQWISSSSEYKIVLDTSLRPRLRIEFNDVLLVCYSKKDSIYIENTSGFFSPWDNYWYGNNGKVYWERAGFSKDSVFATLNRYKINMKDYEYNADSVEFTHLGYFKSPLLGKLDENLTFDTDVSKVVFPKFISYEEVVLKNVVKNVDYKGSFSMQGVKFIGSGGSQRRAILTFYRAGKPFLTATAASFAFRPDHISSTSTAIEVKLRQGKLKHSDVSFRYFIDNQEVALMRPDQNKSENQFINTFHNVFIDADYVHWRMEDTSMYFSGIPGADPNLVRFKSIDFFNEDDFRALQGADNEHPLHVINRFRDASFLDEFPLAQFAAFWGYPDNQVEQILIKLSYMGYLTYDPVTKMAIIEDKLLQDVIRRKGLEDYDIIRFASLTTRDKSNAILNLQTLDMTINGIDEVPVYKKQVERPIKWRDTVINETYERYITINPNDNKILLKQNRSIEYNGIIDVGDFHFYGSDFSFNYDAFKFNLNNVDSLEIDVTETDSMGHRKPGATRCLSKIQDIKGDLYIDSPNNRSASFNNPEFPFFDSKSDSYVYYETAAKHEVTYPRDQLYFKMYPYQVKGMFNFTTKSWRGPGYFEGGGVIPSFEDTLILIRDSTHLELADMYYTDDQRVYSFGFVRKIGDEGLDLYGGKGQLFDALKLSMKGITAAGMIKYQTSTTTSDNFVLASDSMVAHGIKFNVEKQTAGVQYPMVNGEEVDVLWFPYKDRYNVSNLRSPFEMFKDYPVLNDTMVRMNGTLTVTPEALEGRGIASFAYADLMSDFFKFGSSNIGSDTARFQLRNDRRDSVNFAANQVSSLIDLEKKVGYFKSLDTASFIDLTKNRYICYMDQFEWYMDKEEIEISASEQALVNYAKNTGRSTTDGSGNPLTGAVYISQHPAQDSLTFISNTGTYNLRDKTITLKDVSLVEVADAAIYPSSYVVIEPNAKVRTMDSCIIIANTETKYHEIFNARVDIYGKYDYGASGQYYYVDENNERQLIKFSEITVDTAKHTFARGEITVIDNFMISPKFGFEGKVELRADIQYLMFQGYMRMQHACDSVGSYKFKFESYINPDSLYIPLSERLWDINRHELFAGMYITNQEAHVYPAFISKLKSRYDVPMLPLQGYLYYDKNSGYYKISTMTKLQNPDTAGNYMEMHHEFCYVHANGKIDLGLRLGQVALTTAGKINYDVFQDKSDLDVLLGVDFFFAKNALEMLTKDIADNAELEPVDMISEKAKAFKIGMTEWIGTERLDKIYTDMADKGEFELPKELEHTITFTQLKFNWDDPTRSYQSTGKIGIGSINGVQINKMVDGHVQLIKKRSGHKLRIYLEIAPGKWYYFDYFRGLMQTISSNEDYNKTIIALKEKETKAPQDKGQEFYQFRIGTPQLKDAFLDQYDPGYVPEADDDIEDVNTDDTDNNNTDDNNKDDNQKDNNDTDNQ